MRQEGASTQMIKAAIDALTNALEFCETNFNTEADRNHIMQVVCETTQNQDEDIQVASLQCLVEIMKVCPLPPHAPRGSRAARSVCRVAGPCSYGRRPRVVWA